MTADEKDNPLTGLRFLAAEDNMINADILKELLEMEGARCEIAGNGLAALAMFRSSKPGYYDMLLMDVKAFVVGGILCAIGQLILMKTQLTSARILVGYVTAGVILGALGMYGPLVDFAGAGATVPLTGFGYLLANGAMEAAKSEGILGAFTGGVTAAAGGIAAAVFFGYLAALIFKPKMKS